MSHCVRGRYQVDTAVCLQTLNHRGDPVTAVCLHCGFFPRYYLLLYVACLLIPCWSKGKLTQSCGHSQRKARWKQFDQTGFGVTEAPGQKLCAIGTYRCIHVEGKGNTRTHAQSEMPTSVRHEVFGWVSGSPPQALLNLQASLNRQAARWVRRGRTVAGGEYAPPPHLSLNVAAANQP